MKELPILLLDITDLKAIAFKKGRIILTSDAHKYTPLMYVLPESDKELLGHIIAHFSKILISLPSPLSSEFSIVGDPVWFCFIMQIMN